MGKSQKPHTLDFGSAFSLLLSWLRCFYYFGGPLIFKVISGFGRGFRSCN
jgi:hypothetical protein